MFKFRAVAATAAVLAVTAISATVSTVPAGAAIASGLFQPLPAFAPGSVWTSPVSGSLDPSSAPLVARLNTMVNQEIAGKFGPYVNTTAYSVPVYTVPTGQPTVAVVLDNAYPYAATLKTAFAAGVPIPVGAQAAKGSDQHLVIWQPSSDTMWEFWHMAVNATDGKWHASWGGKMTNVSQNPGYFNGAWATGVNQYNWGATATSLPLVAGLVTVAELQAGVVNHALSIALPQTEAKHWAWPAQRTDGGDTALDAIPEGAHFRIDPNLDLNSLGLPPVTLILARAAQKYGIIVRDKSGCVTFYAQDPTPTGTNPYPALFGNLTPVQLMSTFPWSHLQLLPMTLH